MVCETRCQTQHTAEGAGGDLAVLSDHYARLGSAYGRDAFCHCSRDNRQPGVDSGVSVRLCGGDGGVGAITQAAVVVLSVAGVLLLLWPLWNNLYPVPDFPDRLWPYIVGGWVLAGAVWAQRIYTKAKDFVSAGQ
jgi:hypothetical protein